MIQTGPTGCTGPVLFGPTGATGPTGPTGFVAQRGIKYLYDRVRIELVGASDNMIASKFYEVFDEFFRDSMWWREVIIGELFANQLDYYLQPQHEPGGRIIRLGGVYDKNGFPVAATMPSPGFVRLLNPMNNNQTVAIVVMKSCEIPHGNELPRVPRYAVEGYEHYLLDGIAGKLMMQPNRAYSDNANGKQKYLSFRNGVNEAKIDAQHQNTFGRNAWFYPQQFRQTSQYGAISVGNNYDEF